ncbi:MAG: T9SS type A sorting domain-containing protein [Saprospiraceae bacterium]|nr:T9SS type A sorting domain-containing protein [Saprospiraceae bacterium]
MKNLKKAFMLSALFALVMHTQLGAADVPTITIRTTGFAKKVSLVVADLASHATVQLKDLQGNILLDERIKSAAQFAKVFNLEQLPAGMYRLVVITETRETIQPLTLTETGITVDENQREVIFTPAIICKNGYVDVSMLNNRLTTVEMTVFDAAGDKVFSDTQRNVIKVERRYDTSSLPQGNYLVRVSTPYRTYYKDLTIK